MFPRFQSKTGSALVLAALISSGCATTVVTEESKDKSGSYDGNWTAEVFKASTPQRVHNWIFRCSDLSQTAPMTVVDGVVTITLDRRKYTTFVGADGKFKMLIKEGRASASTSSDISFGNPNVNVFVSGGLGQSPAKGSLLVGFAEVGFNGCHSKIQYSRN